MALLAADARCLGAWHFGSLSRGLADRFSDVDPVVLVTSAGYDSLVRERIPKKSRLYSASKSVSWGR